MNLADIIAICANLALLLLVFVSLIKIIIKNHIAQLVLMVLLAVFAMFIRCYHDMTITEVMRGVIGDLSLSSLLFMFVLAVSYFADLKIQLFNRSFCLIIAITGLVLYLTTLDIIPVDIYKFGFLPKSFLAIVMLLCMLFLYLNPVFAIISLIGLIAFLAKLQNSVNLWDYLIDPVLWLLCLYKLFFNKTENIL